MLDLDRLTGDGGFLLLLWALLVLVLATGRVTRLLTHDSFPPAFALRSWWFAKSPDGWEDLAECPWCLAPWLTLINLGWAIGGTVDPDTISGLLWLLGNTWFALAYVVSMVVVRDEPADE